MGTVLKDFENNDLSLAEEGFLKGNSTASPMALTMILKTACELQLFDLIANATTNTNGPDSHLSAVDIASFLPTQNPQAPAMLDRMLRLLASASFLNCKVVTTFSEDGKSSPTTTTTQRLYNLAPLSESLVRNEDAKSYADLALLVLDRVIIDSWHCLKDAILEGGVPFDRAHGMHAFEYPATDSRFNEVFNKGMFSNTLMSMKRIVEVYNGFEGVKELVDVGGGFGGSVEAIVYKYPNIRAINFDLPHVIQNATPIKGVEHVAGDMFESVPSGEVIFMKWILHDWSDDHCLKILKNCLKALPESGKVIVVDKILPEHPDSDLVSSIGFHSDVTMMVINPGGKERTLSEWEVLANGAGFASIKPICRAYSDCIMEFYKKN